jgi:hypothetical protein
VDGGGAGVRGGLFSGALKRRLAAHQLSVVS